MLFCCTSRYVLRTAAIALLVALLAGEGLAAPAAQDDEAEVRKAEDYLNAMHTLKAHFMQVSPDGGTAEGTVYLSRPGHMRLEYDPPAHALIVADGSWLIYYDKQLQQTSYTGLESTPAGVLLEPQVKLDGDDLEVTGVRHQPGLLEITVAKKSDSDQGRITLVFTNSPFQLKQWRVTDQQGQITLVALSDAHVDVSLDKDLFEFNDPQFTGQPYLAPLNK